MKRAGSMVTVDSILKVISTYILNLRKWEKWYLVTSALTFKANWAAALEKTATFSKIFLGKNP